MGFRDLFESKEAREARLETEKFNLRFKLSTKLREVDRELNKAKANADKFYQEASTYKAAGNKEQALTSYNQYLVSRKLRQTLSKSWEITYQATFLMKANNLTNEVFELLNEGLKNTQLEPAKIQQVVQESAKLQEAFDQVGTQLNDALDSGGASEEAEKWFSESATADSGKADSTSGLEEMKSTMAQLNSKG